MNIDKDLSNTYNQVRDQPSVYMKEKNEQKQISRANIGKNT